MTKTTQKRNSIFKMLKNASKAMAFGLLLAGLAATNLNAQTTGYWTGTSIPTTTTANVRVSDGDIWIRSVDNNHGIGYYGGSKLFGGLTIDGPVVYGWAGGALGTTKSGSSNQVACLRWFDDGKVSIGNVPLTRPGDYKLYVEGGILTEKVRVAVETSSDWADYVFSEDYKLMPLAQLKDYVSANKHLPDVPSASDVVSKGLDLQKMDATLLQKVEELTLYVLQQQHEITELKKAVAKKK